MTDQRPTFRLANPMDAPSGGAGSIGLAVVLGVGLLYWGVVVWGWV